MGKVVKILSIDGGGIRGIIPAMVLNNIEKKMGKQSSRIFDIIAGTSTGGILALGLSRPDDMGNPMYSAGDMARLYTEYGEKIFSRSIWHALHAMDNLTQEKYPSKGIDSVLNEFFGEARLRDATTELIIPAYEIERRIPWFFKRHRAMNTPIDYDFKMSKVARATSAAPTYFEPAYIKTGGVEEYFAFVDGGVFANNPAMCAFAEAKTIYPDAEDILILSLGTGNLTKPLMYKNVKDWGLIEWAQPLIDVVFDGVSDTVNYQVKQLLPYMKGNERRYFRFEVKLNEEEINLDDASPENIRRLKLLADNLIDSNKDAIDDLCEMLTKYEGKLTPNHDNDVKL